VNQRRPRYKDPKYLEWVRDRACVVCGAKTQTEEAAHIRMKDPSVGKPMTGMGTKPDDFYVLPLCGEHHRQQHNGSEKSFWANYKADPVKAALALYVEYKTS
jgi:hypothetical protein